MMQYNVCFSMSFKFSHFSSRPLSTEINPSLSRNQSSPDLGLLVSRSTVDLTYFQLPNFVYALNHVYFESCVGEICKSMEVSLSVCMVSILRLHRLLLDYVTGSYFIMKSVAYD